MTYKKTKQVRNGVGWFENYTKGYTRGTIIDRLEKIQARVQRQLMHDMEPATEAPGEPRP